MKFEDESMEILAGALRELESGLPVYRISNTTMTIRRCKKSSWRWRRECRTIIPTSIPITPARC
jgi:hypothetical protein